MDLPQGNWNQETPIEQQNLAEFDKLCESVFTLKNEIAADEKAIDEKKEVLNKLQNQVMAIMKKHGKDKYLVNGFGTLSIQKNFSWALPQDLEAKEKFFNYLRQRGVFMELVSVNSRTLNAFCKAELEVAKEKGQVDWNPDGLREPSVMEKIRITKSK